MVARALTLLLGSAAALTPAMAQSVGSVVPEPSAIALFGLGVAGLIIGRHYASRRPDE